MTARKFPVAGFRPAPADLFEVLHALPEEKMAEEMGVNAFAFRRWLDGAEPVPLIAYKLASIIAGRTLPASFGPFAGARFESGRLFLDGYAGKEWGLSADDLRHLAYLRHYETLANGLDAQLRRALKERDFYKGQCAREARFGLMLNRLFKPKT